MFEVGHRVVPRMGINCRSDGDGLAPVLCPLVPRCRVAEEERQVVPTGQAGKLPALPSMCSPGALVGRAHAPWQGGAHWGIAQAVFFVLGLMEPCWSSSELCN